MRRLIYTLSLSSLLCLLPSCAVAPPDVPICIEDDIDAGFCVRTISGESFTIDDKHPFVKDGETYSWLDLRPYMIMMPMESWAEIKKFILDICKLSKQCSGGVANWERTVNTIDQETQAKQQ